MLAFAFLDTVSDSSFYFLFFCSPPHVKSELEDNSYYSPKLEKSLKRERDDNDE